MKNLSVLLILSFISTVHAQFKLEGTINGYESKPVFIKIYENGSERLIKRVETNDSGNFSYNFPNEYIGKIILELNQGAFETISDNSDLSFSVDLNDPTRNINYSKGINTKIQDYFGVEDKKTLSDFTLKELLKMYNPQDEFYTALQKEITRIDALAGARFENEAIQYYADAKNEVAKINRNDYTTEESMTMAKNRFVNDNMNFENFGLLQDYLSIYISYAIDGAKNKEEAATKIETALDQLLAEVGTDTSRGQAVLSNIIPMLDGNGFQELSTKYLNQAESLTCEITPDLQYLIDGKNNVKVGAKVPNIEFDKKIKNAKSLYDVKADKKLIVFWASWCPHCVKEIPHIKEFYPDFQSQGGEIIAVSLDMEKTAFDNATKDTQWINYSDLMKWESPIVKQYGISSTPTMILLDKDNNVVKIGSRVSEFL